MKLLYKISLAFNLLFIAVVVYLGFNGKKLIKNYVFDKVIKIRHEQKLSMFRATPVFKGAIIFVGNSITEGGNWSELFPEKNILNRGIGGDISVGVLARIDEIIRHQPSKLFVCIGTNDLAKGVERATIINNYKRILVQIKTQSPRTKIYVQSILPVGKDVIYGHNNEGIKPMNAEIEKMCSELQVTYINLYANFVDKTGYLNSEYTNDKLHLMGKGYLLWTKLIEPYVNESL